MISILFFDFLQSVFLHLLLVITELILLGIDNYLRLVDFGIRHFFFRAHFFFYLAMVTYTNVDICRSNNSTAELCAWMIGACVSFLRKSFNWYSSEKNFQTTTKLKLLYFYSLRCLMKLHPKINDCPPINSKFYKSKLKITAPKKSSIFFFGEVMKVWCIFD